GGAVGGTPRRAESGPAPRRGAWEGVAGVPRDATGPSRLGAANRGYFAVTVLAALTGAADGDPAVGPDRHRRGVLQPVDERLQGGAANAFWSRLAERPTLLLQGGVEGLLRRGQAWPELERLAVAGDGLVQLALGHQRNAQVVVGVGVLRVEFDGLVEAGDGLVYLPLAPQRNAQAGVGLGVLRVE